MLRLFTAKLLPATVAILAFTAIAAFALVSQARSGPRLETLAAGAVTMSNSRDGEAILSVDDLAPGESTSGTVTIENSGSMAGSLGFSTMNSTDLPGRGGDMLSPALEFVVTELAEGVEVPVYSGPLDVVSSLDLSSVPPGEARTYRLTAHLPDTGVPETDVSGDNALQGATAGIGFVWILTADPTGECGSILRGGPGRDRIRGTSFADEIDGGGGADVITGRDGDDCMAAGPGDDRVSGNRGADELFGGPGKDVLRGGPGDDTFRADADGSDLIFCGSGRDRVRAGPRDRTVGC